MFDIGWQELILIGIVALVAIGPKDLPAAMRTLARLASRGRALSREFQSGLAEVMREAELDEFKRKVGRVDLGKVVKDEIDPTGTLAADFDPADFARRLKEEVEAGPPKRRSDPTTAPTTAPTAAPAADGAATAAPAVGRHDQTRTPGGFDASA